VNTAAFVYGKHGCFLDSPHFISYCWKAHGPGERWLASILW